LGGLRRSQGDNFFDRLATVSFFQSHSVDTLFFQMNRAPDALFFAFVQQSPPLSSVFITSLAAPDALHDARKTGCSASGRFASSLF